MSFNKEKFGLIAGVSLVVISTFYLVLINSTINDFMATDNLCDASVTVGEPVEVIEPLTATEFYEVAPEPVASIAAVTFNINKALTSMATGMVATKVTPLEQSGLYQADVGGVPMYFTGDASVFVLGEAFSVRDGHSFTEAFKSASASQVIPAQTVEATNVVLTPVEIEADAKPEPIVEAQPAPLAITPATPVASSVDSSQRFPSDYGIATGALDSPYQVAVFTDPDCPYCRAFEKDVENLDDIEVMNYLYPIQALHPNAVTASNKIWCSANQSDTLHRYMTGETSVIDQLDAQCETPIEKIQAIGQKMGLRGTPTFLSSDGRVLEGYPGREAFIKWVKNKS